MANSEKLLKERYTGYYKITSEAKDQAKKAPENLALEGAREDCLDMVDRYISDAEHFFKEGKLIEAVAALSYAHGWLDMGARIGLWEVNDSRLFTVDEK